MLLCAARCCCYSNCERLYTHNIIDNTTHSCRCLHERIETITLAIATDSGWNSTVINKP